MPGTPNWLARAIAWWSRRGCVVSASVRACGVVALSITASCSSPAPQPPSVARPLARVRLQVTPLPSFGVTGTPSTRTAEEADPPDDPPIWLPGADFFPTLREGGQFECPPRSRCLPDQRDLYFHLHLAVKDDDSFADSVAKAAAALVTAPKLEGGHEVLLTDVEYPAGDAALKALARRVRQVLGQRGLSEARVLTREVPKSEWAAGPGIVEIDSSHAVSTPPSPPFRAFERTLRPDEGPPAIVCPSIPRGAAELAVTGGVVVDLQTPVPRVLLRDAIVIRNPSGVTSPPTRLVVGTPCAGEVVVPRLCPGATFHVLCQRASIPGEPGELTRQLSVAKADLHIEETHAITLETVSLSLTACHRADNDFTAVVLDTPVGFPASPLPLTLKVTRECVPVPLFDFTRRTREEVPREGWSSARISLAAHVARSVAGWQVLLARAEGLERDANTGEALASALKRRRGQSGYDRAEMAAAHAEATRLVALRPEAARLRAALR